MKHVFATAALTTAVAMAAASTASARDLDVASTFPEDMLYLGDALTYFGESLERVTGGELGVNIHGAGELVPALEVFSAVRQGAIEAGYDWMAYWGGEIPVANLAGSLPFGPEPLTFADWMWEGEGMEIIQGAYDQHNVKVLPCVVVPAEPAGWFNKEINTPEDFEGLRMRIGGLGGRALAKLGASPQTIAGGEVYVSLDRGRIDAAEFSLPAIDETLQLNDAADYYYFPGWHQPASFNSVLINMDVWNDFDETQQDQVTAACRSTLLWSMTNAIQHQAEAITRLEEAGVEVRRFPEPVLDALREATDEVIAEEMERDETFREAYESLSAHVERADRWYDLQDM